jgi:hypothetical protein
VAAIDPPPKTVAELVTLEGELVGTFTTAVIVDDPPAGMAAVL